jgi:16S rRNA (cytidine1402-2'-O)-methyltransferase
MSGKIYLIPTTLGSDDWESVIPPKVIEITRSLRHFVVEDIRTARRYLARIKATTPIDSIEFYTLNEHTGTQEVERLLEPLLNEYDVGIISEAGVPVVADPGANLVRLAHSHGIEVIPLTGPSSVILALMASGLNGQNFAFLGYLPVKPDERRRRLRHIEQVSRNEKQTQIFIEAPYRNNQLLRDIIATCSDETHLTVACELTTQHEFVRTKRIGDWKRTPIPDINKKNVCFCLLG